MKLEHHITPYTKINSKWIKDLNVRPDTIKLLEEDNIGEKLHYIGFGFDFLGMTSKAQAIKAKMDKWECIKFLKFCASKETFNRVKRQPPQNGRKYLQMKQLTKD